MAAATAEARKEDDAIPVALTSSLIDGDVRTYSRRDIYNL